MTIATRRFPASLDIAFWLSVLSGERRGLGYGLLRGVLSVIAACYSAGLAIYLAAEHVGLRRRSALPVPIISIGNITSGGTGKTPFTQLIAETLLDHGLKPAILSRGHGGRLSGANAQVSDDQGNILVPAEDAGDEAAALARLMPGVPVYVGKNRVRSGLLALKQSQPHLLVLDDGLQYWQLRRDLDIVLVDSREPFHNGWPIPRGTLREPKKNIARAGMIVITRSSRADERELIDLENEINTLAPSAAVFRADHKITRLSPLNDQAYESPSPLRPAIACGIAQPEAFYASLQAARVPVTKTRFVALADHACFDQLELESIRSIIHETDADALIVTGKDAVKFDAALFDVPVYAAELAIAIQDSDRFWRELTRRAGLGESMAAASARR